MAQFDAQINLILSAQKALKEADKVAKEINKKFNSLKVQVGKKGPLDKYIQQNDELVKQKNIQNEIIKNSKTQTKQAEKTLQTELALASAKELYVRRVKQLERAGGATNKELQAQLEAVKKLVAFSGDNVGVMSRAATLTGRILERQRALNRENLRSNTILNRTAKFTERIEKIRGRRNVQSLVNLNKLLQKQARGRLDIAVDTERKLREQLRIKEESIKAEDKSLAIASKQREQAERRTRQTKAAALRMRAFARSMDTVINKFESLNRAQRAVTQLALPSTGMLKPQKRGIQLLDMSTRSGRDLPPQVQQRLDRNAQRNKQLEIEMLALNKARKRAIDNNAAAKRAEGRETIRLAQLEQGLTDKTAARSKAVSSPVRGGANFPGSPGFFQAQASRRQKGFTNIATGVGFPLLFGGGPGSVAGGLLGGLGGGFGGSILGSAIGAQFDKLGETAKRLADSLKDPVNLLNEMSTAGFIVSDSLKEQVKALQEQGLVADAAELAISALTEKLGSTGVQNIKRFDEASDKLRDRMATLALVVFSELVPAINVFINGITTIIDKLLGPEVQRQAANLNPAAFQQAQAQALAESSATLLGGSRATYEDRLNVKSAQIVAQAAMPAGATEAAEAAQKTQLAINSKQVNILKDKLDLERQSNTENLSIKRTLQEQIVKDEFAIEKLKAKGDKHKIAIADLNRQIKLQQIFNQFTLDHNRILEEQEKARQRNKKLQEANTTRLDIDKQRLTIAQGQGNLLDKSVYAAQKQIINLEYDANLRRETNKELKEGNALVLKNTALTILRNNRQTELNSLVEKNNRETEKAQQQFKKAKDLTAELENQAKLQAVSGSVEEKKLRINIAYEKLLKQIREQEDQSFVTRQEELANKIKINAEAMLETEEAEKQAAAIRNAVAPIKNIRENQEANLAASKEYSRLLMEGVLPSEAKRIVEFNKQVDALIKQKNEQIKIAELVLLRLPIDDELTEQYREQLDLLKKQKTAIEGEASKGPGKGDTSDRKIIEDRVAELRGELTEMTKLGNVAVKVADNIGAAFSTAFQDVINGSKSTQQALSDMFKTIGENFVAMAADIIAQQIQMIILQTILKALGAVAGASSGGTQVPSDVPQMTPNAVVTPTGFQGQFAGMAANGGPVEGGRPYMVGERGPEMFIPGSSGGIMRNEDMRQMMGRSPAGASAPQMNFTFETTNIGGTEFVSREQLEVAMSTTRRQAASDGAKQGMSMTLDKMQNSPRTRSRVGIR